MPYEGDTTQAPTTTAPSTADLAEGRTVTVIPAVDLFLGTVTILTGNGAKAPTGRFSHPHPQLIAQALAQAVRPTRWCEVSRTLTVTVAAVGKRGGQQRLFTLSRRGQA
ncbi:hypothetical protein CQ020_09210 [Arthrobacter sp. MYb23]|uniref:hypothetical protein n=1 Tax=unclassified Arthrobacter TaxID=235627 RepID=UPI000CFC7819|nr:MULTISPECIES: hypothetical protein [unclassified Arthrobacter]PRB42688.1 hypothetical protein CQ038_09615 [Arthrobacter sp. MYb51]PRB96635.1 hypothetical protein CQ020_09210 [Arthrobacter sp. MYb23]